MKYNASSEKRLRRDAFPDLSDIRPSLLPPFPCLSIRPCSFGAAR
jgi:hypothetical protein